MPSIRVSLHMPALNVRHFDGAEIWFKEGDTFKRLDAEEWKAFFPGCEFPIAVAPGGTRDTEEVWVYLVPQRLLYLASAVGLGTALSNLARPGDHVLRVRRARNTLMISQGQDINAAPLDEFFHDYLVACERWPEAAPKVERVGDEAPRTISPPLHGDEAAHSQIQSMAMNEIRRAYDRNEIDVHQYQESIRHLASRRDI